MLFHSLKHHCLLLLTLSLLPSTFLPPFPRSFLLEPVQNLEAGTAGMIQSQICTSSPQLLLQGDRGGLRLPRYRTNLHSSSVALFFGRDVEGAPFQYPGYHVPGDKVNNQNAGVLPRDSAPKSMLYFLTVC